MEICGGGALYALWSGDFGTDRSLGGQHQPYYDYSRFNTQRLPAFHQLDVRVDKSFFFRKWSLIFYADIQNIYNYKALGPDELVPVENPDGSYRKDPDREGYYQMRSIKNELGGTVLPSVGVM